MSGTILGGGFIQLFYFHPKNWRRLLFLTSIFQRGWNHQLGNYVSNNSLEAPRRFFNELIEWIDQPLECRWWRLQGAVCASTSIHLKCWFFFEIPLQGQGGEVATWDVLGCQYHDMIAFLRAILFEQNDP